MRSKKMSLISRTIDANFVQIIFATSIIGCTTLIVTGNYSLAFLTASLTALGCVGIATLTDHMSSKSQKKKELAMSTGWGCPSQFKSDLDKYNYGYKAEEQREQSALLGTSGTSGTVNINPGIVGPYVNHVNQPVYIPVRGLKPEKIIKPKDTRDPLQKAIDEEVEKLRG